MYQSSATHISLWSMSFARFHSLWNKNYIKSFKNVTISSQDLKFWMNCNGLIHYQRWVTKSQDSADFLFWHGGDLNLFMIWNSVDPHYPKAVLKFQFTLLFANQSNLIEHMKIWNALYFKPDNIMYTSRKKEESDDDESVLVENSRGLYQMGWKTVWFHYPSLIKHELSKSRLQKIKNKQFRQSKIFVDSNLSVSWICKFQTTQIWDWVRQLKTAVNEEAILQEACRKLS